MGFTPTAVGNVFIETVVAGSAATTYSSNYLTGELLSISYVKVDFEDGVDFDITAETTTQELWDQDNVNASATVYPRVATVDSNAAASLYASGGEPVEDKIVLCGERVKIVITTGGTSKTGKFLVAVRR